jgi:hypothetical protein
VLNVAVTDVAAETVTEQVPVPVQAPDHPAKVEPAFGVAVSVTAVPLANPAEQVEPQLIPAGELVTDPVPVPALWTVSWKLFAAAVLNVAVTAVAAEAVMLHVPVPVQPPDHPANVEPEFGVAVSVTEVPTAKLALHVCPQVMPAGLLLTLPAPVPAAVTVIWTGEGVVTCDDPQPE